MGEPPSPARSAIPAITVDLARIQAWYRKKYGGAMYSGCGGGYLIVASERHVPGSFGIPRQAPEVLSGRPGIRRGMTDPCATGGIQCTT